ncbi:MAG: DUF3861 family protein [Actinomycetaceae bacterium]|nr:DUF3861 family protein [Actinomycetaceae bacterium]
MKNHIYTITCTHTKDKEGNTVDSEPTFQFESYQHDSIEDILAKLSDKHYFNDKKDLIRFIVGLKIMSSAMMHNRSSDFVRQLEPHFKEMMNIIKGRKPKNTNK